MGFFGSLISATVKTVLTPIAIVKDVGNVITGEEVDATSTLIDSVIEDIGDAADEIV